MVPSRSRRRLIRPVGASPSSKRTSSSTRRSTGESATNARRMASASNRIGANMLPSSAEIHAARSQSSSFPGVGPALLLMRMSASGHAAIRRSRPSSVVMSALTVTGRRPVACSIRSAAPSKASWFRPLTKTRAPSRASDVAQASPKPRDEAQTMAERSLIPRSMT